MDDECSTGADVIENLQYTADMAYTFRVFCESYPPLLWRSKTMTSNRDCSSFIPPAPYPPKQKNKSSLLILFLIIILTVPAIKRGAGDLPIDQVRRD